MDYNQSELLFEVTERLKQNSYIDNVLGFNVNDKLTESEISLPLYSHQRLQEVIEQETSHKTT